MKVDSQYYYPKYPMQQQNYVGYSPKELAAQIAPYLKIQYDYSPSKMFSAASLNIKNLALPISTYLIGMGMMLHKSTQKLSFPVAAFSMGWMAYKMFDKNSKTLMNKTVKDIMQIKVVD